MKKILITGANSYIGTSFENYLRQWSNKYIVDTLNMLNSSWREKDFSIYDVVFHVAGIAHKKETIKNAHLYYEVNRDLAIETAEKAKKAGVKQFVFLSSMSVYGKVIGNISENEIPNPVSNYGKSKLQAEEGIKKLENNNFKVAIVRPPMVYGKGCKGNYNFLSKAAKKLPIFPQYKNLRSMIYIDNLCEFIGQLIQKSSSGIFLPQDSNYICTSDMVRLIAENSHTKIIFTKVFNPFVKILGINLIKKVFGNLTYEKIDYGFDYNVIKELSKAISEIEG